MAEDLGYGYCHYHDDNQSDHNGHDDHEAGYPEEVDAAAESLDVVASTDHDAGHGAEGDNDVSGEESADDAHFLGLIPVGGRIIR